MLLPSPDRISARRALRAANLLLMALAVLPVRSAPQPQDRSKGVPAMTFALRSPDFANGANIPRAFTCEGEDRSPALEWTDAPPGTKTFALIADDPDAPVGTWVHWVIYNIPGSARADRRRGEERATRGRIASGPQRFPQDGLQRSLPASRQSAPLLFQTVCLERRTGARCGRRQERCGARDGSAHPGANGVDGPLPAVGPVSDFPQHGFPILCCSPFCVV